MLYTCIIQAGVAGIAGWTRLDAHGSLKRPANKMQIVFLLSGSGSRSGRDAARIPRVADHIRPACVSISLPCRIPIVTSTRVQNINGSCAVNYRSILRPERPVAVTLSVFSTIEPYLYASPITTREDVLLKKKKRKLSETQLLRPRACVYSVHVWEDIIIIFGSAIVKSDRQKWLQCRADFQLTRSAKSRKVLPLRRGSTEQFVFRSDTYIHGNKSRHKIELILWNPAFSWKPMRDSAVER